MQDLMSIFKEFGPYLGIPIVVHFLVNGMKSKIPFFKSVTGLRILHFLPLILGALGGLLLPDGSIGDKVLTGGALGCLNLVIYKTVSVTFAKTSTIQGKIDRKNPVVEEVEVVGEDVSE